MQKFLKDWHTGHVNCEVIPFFNVSYNNDNFKVLNLLTNCLPFPNTFVYELNSNVLPLFLFDNILSVTDASVSSLFSHRKALGNGVFNFLGERLYHIIYCQ